LDVHLAGHHDWYCIGHLPDRQADLEEMFQHTKFYGGTTSGTFGSPYADSQSTTDISRSTATNNQATKSNASIPIHINIS
jgi:hypothetical protein